MYHDTRDRIIALAGIFQAVSCMTRIAHRGSTDRSAMEISLYSLLQVDAPTVDAVFGERGALAPAVRHLIAQLTGQPSRDPEQISYAMLLVKLERALSARPDLLARLEEGITEAQRLRERVPLLDIEMLAHLAALYTSTISTLSPRIMVRGDSRYLSDVDYQHQIRALLLAGIRSAMLWRQVGGSRWQFLFKNRQLLAAARAYLAECEE